MTREEFRDYYENQHVPLCLKYAAGQQRYLRRYLEPSPGLPEPGFDVITEVWFTDRKSLDMVIGAIARGLMPADVIADEEKLFDRSATRAYAVSECETELEEACDHKLEAMDKAVGDPGGRGGKEETQ